MDCELEICRGGKIFVQRICYQSIRCASCIARNLRPDSLDSTLWPFDTSSDNHSNQASPAQSPAIDIPQCHTVLHHDIHSDLYGYGHAVRTVPPLSVLCLYGLVNTVPVMESWLASDLNIRGLGSSRMGVERVPDYQHKLHRGSRVFVRSGVFCVVGYEKRVRRVYARRR